MPEYYHGNLTREEAERRLEEDGDFLIRTTDHKPGCYVLDIKRTPNPFHVSIPKNPASIQIMRCN
jgi:SH2 domain